MLKNLSALFQEIEGWGFHLICDPNSPLPIVKEVLVKYLAHVSNVEDQVKAQQAAQPPVTPPVAEAVAPCSPCEVIPIDQPKVEQPTE